jgi:putative tricarboxylic transport membrane protein
MPKRKSEHHPPPGVFLILKEHDVISSLIWIVVSALFCRESFDLGLGSLTEPGAGLFPFLISVCLIFFSAILFAASLRKRGGFSFIEIRKSWPDWEGFRRIGLTVLFLVSYVIALNYLGFALTTFLFIFLLLRFIEPQKWPRVVLGSLLIAAGSYAIFEIWLRTNLPAGFLGF